MRLSILHSKAANSPCFKFPFLKAVAVAAQRRLPFRAVGNEGAMPLLPRFWQISLSQPVGADYYLPTGFLNLPTALCHWMSLLSPELKVS